MKGLKYKKTDVGEKNWDPKKALLQPFNSIQKRVEMHKSLKTEINHEIMPNFDWN